MQYEQGQLLRIFVAESDKHQGKPLYEWIIHQARDAHMAGATALKGVEGFGAHSRIHSSKLLDLSADLPIIVEIVDEAQKIEKFVSIIESVIQEGMATIEDVNIRYFRSKKV